MKYKTLFLLMLICFLGTFASPEGIANHTKKAVHCNNKCPKAVTGNIGFISDTEATEMSPVSLLLFEI
jgi:hypothetical protein